MGKELDISSNNILEETKLKIRQVAQEIRKIKPVNDANDQLSEETKNKLRKLYTQFQSLCGKVVKLSDSKEEQAEYKKHLDRATELAKSYGSKMSIGIPNTTFDDVKGLDEVKKLVKSFMFMAKNPQLMKHYHIDGGLGMLMYGAPGTGKTLFAKAVANELQLPLFIITPSEIFKSHVGESEESVKLLFEEIDEHEDGSLLFIDECESIFSTRSSDTQDYKAAVTTELLQRINGFSADGTNRIMMAATNRPQDIDPAYLRYKRFTHHVHITPPDKVAIEAIVASKLDGIRLVDELSVGKITELIVDRIPNIIVNGQEVPSYYYSSADVCAIIEEACRIALENIEMSKSTDPIPLTKEMFVGGDIVCNGMTRKVEGAINRIKPSISYSLLQEYIQFDNKEAS